MQNTIESRLERYRSVRNINIDNKIIDAMSYETEEEGGNGSGEKVIFAYVYSNQYTEEVEYVALGNNIISKDGSYMCGFFKKNHFNINYKIIEKIIKRLEELEPSFKKKINYTRVFKPDANSLKKENLPLTIFCLKTLAKYILITFVLRKQSRIFSVAFLNRLFSNYNVSKSLEKEGLDINIMNVMFNKTGQKIVPKGFYYMDNKLIKSRDYKNESYLLYRLSKEVFMKNTPAFPIVINSAELQNVSTEIWDNNSLIDKLNNSRLISSNNKFKLKDVYTGKLNMFIMEDCGDTLARYISNGGRLLGDIILKKECMESMIFQIFHSIYILNKIGFVHGDTHLSNITVRETVRWFNNSNNQISSNSLKKKYYSVFRIGDSAATNKNIYFKVKFYGAYITLIDLGRSVDIQFVENNKKEIYNYVVKIFNLEFLHADIQKIDSNTLFCLYNLCDMYKILQGIGTFLKSTSSLDSSESVENTIKHFSSEIYKEAKMVSKNKNSKSAKELTGNILVKLFDSLKINLSSIGKKEEGLVDCFYELS